MSKKCKVRNPTVTTCFKVYYQNHVLCDIGKQGMCQKEAFEGLSESKQSVWLPTAVIDTIQRTESPTGNLHVVSFINYLQFIKLKQHSGKDLQF